MADKQIQEEPIQEESATMLTDDNSQGERDLKETLKKIKEHVFKKMLKK